MPGITDGSLNVILTNQTDNLNQEIDTVSQKTQYIVDSTSSLKAINKILFFVYILLIVFVSIGFLMRAYRTNLLKLNLKVELGIIFIAILFPYLAATMEKLIYAGIMYVYSMVTGSVYINRFDQLFNKTDFYYNPGKQ